MPDANVRAVITAEDRASRTIQNFGSNIGTMGTKIARTAKFATAALVAASAAAVTFGIKAASDFQQARIAFETMLGSAKNAKVLMEDLSDLALKTPFDLPQVVQGAKSLLAYNIEQKKLIPTFKALGNIAAGVGMDKLPQLVLAFGQVRAAGKLTGMELRQFTEAGVPLLDLLGKQSGKTAAQIKKAMEDGAAPSFDEVERAIFSASEEGGKFFNLMERQSKTFSGTLSNLRDVAVRSLSAIVGVSVTGEIREGSIFDFLQRGAKGLLNFLSEHQDSIIGFFDSLLSKLRSLSGWINDHVVPVLRAMWEGFLKVWNIGMTYLKPYIDELVRVFRQELLPAFRELWAKHGKEITLMLKILGGFIGGVLIGIIMGLVGAIILLARMISFAVRVSTALTDKLKEIGRFLGDVSRKFRNASDSARAFSDSIADTALAPVEAIKKLSGLLSGRKRSGGMVRARGGLVRVGEEGPEDVILPNGSKVQRNIDSKLSRGVGTVNFNVNVGYFAGTPAERRKIAQIMWKDLEDIASRHGMTAAKMLGA